jgi:hypothetical protein
MPLEIELLIAAWDNVKKNVFDAEGWNIDPETGEVLAGDMSDDLGDLVADLDDKMCDLLSYYREDDAENIFYGEDDESKFVGVRYADESDDDIRETAANL